MLPPPLASKFRPWMQLLATAVLVTAVWLGILPYVGSRPGIRAYIEQNDSAGIDPSAKFYTELPGMPGFLTRIDDARRRDGAAFGMEYP